VIRLLADHNIPQQAELIWSVFDPAEWNALGVNGLFRFHDIGLDVSANDRQVWLACQAQQLLLLTANRNADGDDSLTAVIAELNHPKALPILTVSRGDRVVEFSYREDCAYRIADIVTRIESLYGTARLFIP
jgi:hypothetical protein